MFYGVLQKDDKLYIVGISLFLKSVFSVVSFIVIDLITKNLLISCLILDLVWLVLFLVYDLPKSKCIVKKDSYSFSNVLRLFKTGFFSFAILFLSVYLVNAQKYALDGVVEESLQAIFGMILMPATIISLAGQYLLQPILNTMANLYSNGEKKEFNKIVFKALLLIVAFGVVCVIGAYILGIPVLNILYSVNIVDYKLHLLIIIFGAILYSMSTLLSAALTTVRYTFVQFIVFSISSVIAFVISQILIGQFSIYGAAIAYLIIMACQFILYVIIYIVIMKKIDFKEVA